MFPPSFCSQYDQLQDVSLRRMLVCSAGRQGQIKATIPSQLADFYLASDTSKHSVSCMLGLLYSLNWILSLRVEHGTRV